MNKVKPQVGQVWEEDDVSEGQETIHHIDEVGNVYWCENRNVFSNKEQMRHWEFVPQNDLEWLAVNECAWDGDNEYPLIYRDDYHDHDQVDYCTLDAEMESYTRQQWQNMRYKLGLDEKPRVSAEKWAQMLRGKQGEKLASLKGDLERRLQRYVGGDWTEMLSDKH